MTDCDTTLMTQDEILVLGLEDRHFVELYLLPAKQFAEKCKDQQTSVYSDYVYCTLVRDQYVYCPMCNPLTGSQ